MSTPAQTATKIAEGLGDLARMSKVQRDQTLRALSKVQLLETQVTEAERERIARIIHSLIAPSEADHAAVLEKVRGSLGRTTSRDLRQQADRGEREYQRLRERLTTESLSRREAAQRLGLSEQQISNLVKNGHLLALEVRRNLRLPKFQFDPRQTKGYLPGLRAVSRAYGGPPLAVLEWLTASHPALDGRTPASALEAGVVDRVVELAAVGQSQV